MFGLFLLISLLFGLISFKAFIILLLLYVFFD